MLSQARNLTINKYESYILPSNFCRYFCGRNLKKRWSIFAKVWFMCKIPISPHPLQQANTLQASTQPINRIVCRGLNVVGNAFSIILILVKLENCTLGNNFGRSFYQIVKCLFLERNFSSICPNNGGYIRDIIIHFMTINAMPLQFSGSQQGETSIFGFPTSKIILTWSEK